MTERATHSSIRVPTFKFVVVGDMNVGKTSMLISHTSNKFEDTYVPTVFENYVQPAIIDGRVAQCYFLDTAGQEDYQRLRVLSYDDADVFMIVFSLVNRQSFLNVKTNWYPETLTYCPKAKILLVGSKLDLVETTKQEWIKGELETEDGSKPFVEEDEAIEMAKEIGAFDYCECSALTQEGLSDAFTKCINAVSLRKSFDKDTPHGSVKGSSAGEAQQTDKEHKQCCVVV